MMKIFTFNAMLTSKLFIRAFKDVYDDILKSKKRMFWFPGGRGSTKSSFISIMVILLMLKFERRRVNALILRKNANTMANSVFSQVLWAIDKLDMGKMVHVRRNPPEITIINSGAKILFRGLDDPLKLKSIKCRVGYIGIVWFEELTEFEEEEIRSVLQTTLRGGSIYKVFYSYNPTKFLSHWVNKQCIVEHPLKVVTHSTYLDVPKSWLGDAFIEEAELLKERNERAYRNEYLGEVTGGGGQVFENLDIRVMTDGEIAHNCDRYFIGMDWGFAISPLCIVVCAWSKPKRELRIIEEVFGKNITNEQCCEYLISLLKKYRSLYPMKIYADSAEPKSIDFMQRNGLPVEACAKGPDSIRYGVRFLQDLAAIVIDPKRCPNVASQFQQYEYQKNRAGEWIDEYPQKHDDAIDAVRYAVSPVANAKFSLFDSFV
jgi:PBSX family phage terminase large subunit